MKAVLIGQSEPVTPCSTEEALLDVLHSDYTACSYSRSLVPSDYAKSQANCNNLCVQPCGLNGFFPFVSMIDKFSEKEGDVASFLLAEKDVGNDRDYHCCDSDLRW